MFTVKVRDSVALGEGERLYSTERIEVVWPGPVKTTTGATLAGRIGSELAADAQATAQDLREAMGTPPAGSGPASNIYEAGIYLDPDVPIGFEPGDPNEGQFIRMGKHVILFGHDATSEGQKRKGGKVWVMNEQGATVATYDL